MAEDITNLDITQNYVTGPNPVGPKPFNKQNLFDFLKDPSSKRVMIPVGKNLKEFNTPDELDAHLSASEKNLEELWTFKGSDISKNFPISNFNDLVSKQKGALSGQEKTGLNLRPTTPTPVVPKFGDVGFDAASEITPGNDDAIDAFSKFYASGLSVTAEGKPLNSYQELRDYFSNNDNLVKWQQNYDIQQRLKKSQIDLAENLQKLNYKETLSSVMGTQKIVSEIRDKEFFGNLTDEEIGNLLDNNYTSPLEGEKQSISLGSAGNLEWLEQGDNFIPEYKSEKVSALNQNTFREYYRSKGYTEEQIDDLEVELRSKARDKKFKDLDQKLNEGSKEYSASGDYFYGELSQRLGTKNEYQNKMNKKGYDLLSIEDKKISESMNLLDKTYRELKQLEKGVRDNPAWFMTPKGEEYSIKKQEYDNLVRTVEEQKKRSGYSGINIYDPETGNTLTPQQVEQLVVSAKSKKPKEYYSKSLLGTLIKDRNALMLNIEDLEAAMDKFNYEQTQTQEYQKTKSLLLQKKGELIAVNSAIYTNDSPFKRKDTGFISGFVQGTLTEEEKVLSGNISRSALARSWYNYAQQSGIPIEQQDTEFIENELTPHFWEGFGETVFGTTAMMVESIAYAAIGNELGAAATASKWFTKLKEFTKLKYGAKEGEFLVGMLEKGMKFSVKAGSQIAAGQSVSSYATEEAVENTFEGVASMFSGIMKNKYTMFMSKWMMGSVGAGIGEFFGNLADAQMEEGMDIRELFEQVYGKDWESQQKQLAYIGIMSIGMAGAGNIDVLLQTKQQFAKYKSSLGGNFTDPLLVRTETMIDEAIESNNSNKKIVKSKKVNIQQDKKPLEVKPETQLVIENKEKAEVEKRIADVDEEFHVVENDGSVNKDVLYRYNKQTGQLESKGYTEFNNDWEQANSVLDEVVKRKQRENGFISRDKVETIARKELGIDPDAQIAFKDGKILYQRDPEQIAKDIRNSVSAVKLARKNTFDNLISERRKKIKEKQFSDIQDVDKINTPEFLEFFNTFKEKFATKIRTNVSSMMYQGAKVIDSSFRGLAKVSDYMAPIMQKFTETAKGKEKFDKFVSLLVSTKEFQNSGLNTDANAVDYARTLALNLLLNEESIVNEFLSDVPEAITAFKDLNEGFIRHVSKNHTGKQSMRINSSFYSTSFDETSKNLSDSDLDATQKEFDLIEEQRRQISSVLERGGVETNLPIVESIRYRESQKGKGLSVAPETFLTNLGENIDGMTPDEIKTLADQKAEDLYDLNKYENYVAVLNSFEPKKKEVIARLNKELKTNFKFANFLFQYNAGNNPLNGAMPLSIKQKAYKAVASVGLRSRQRKAASQIMYRMLETMALRSDSTPEQLLNDTIKFEKVQSERINEFLANNTNSNILFDSIIGMNGAQRIPEIMHNYEKAKADLDAGLDPRRVYAKWGWFVDPAGKMRYAMAPQQMILKNADYQGKYFDSFMEMFQETSINKYSLGQIIDYPDLFTMYPDLKNVTIDILNDPLMEYSGVYAASVKYNINENTGGVLYNSGNSPGRIVLNMAKLKSPSELISTLKHELQHSVQHLENEQGGYNMENANDIIFTKEGVGSLIESSLERFSDISNLYSDMKKGSEHIKEVVDLLSAMGADNNVNYRGAMQVFLVLRNKAAGLKQFGNLQGDDLIESIKIIIDNEINSSFNKIADEADIEKVAKLLADDIMSSKEVNLFSKVLEKNISSYSLYRSIYGEQEARVSEQDSKTLFSTYEDVLRTVSPENETNGNKEYLDSIKKEIDSLFSDADEFLSNSKVLLDRLINSNAIPNDIKADLVKNRLVLAGKGISSKSFDFAEIISPELLFRAVDFGAENYEIIKEIVNGQYDLHKQISTAISKLSAFSEYKLDPGIQSFDYALIQNSSEELFRRKNLNEPIGKYSSTNTFDFKTLDKKIQESREQYEKGLETLFQDDSGVARAAVVIGDTQSVIYSLTDPTVASPLHEMVHIYEKYLTDTEKQNVLDAAGETEWNTNASEYFARGFEKYLADGIPPSSSLLSIFKKFKDWMLQIYGDILGSPIGVDLSPKVKEIYATMLGETQLKEELAVSERNETLYSEKDMLENFIEQMKAQGKPESDIYRGLIEDNGFTPADLSEFFTLKAKQTAQTELEQTGTFKEEAAAISDEVKYNTQRNAQELTIEMQRLSQDEAKGLLAAFLNIPVLDVAVAKVITDMLEKRAAGQSVLNDFEEIAQVGTNLGRALQRFKMIKQNQSVYTLSALVRDLSTKSRRIPQKELNRLNEEAKALDKLTREYENAKRQAEKVDFLNNESPLRPGMSNIDYFLLMKDKLEKARESFSRNLKPWARKSSLSDLWSTAIRGALLTPTSLVVNMTASLVKTVVQGATNEVANLIGLVRSKFFGGKRSTYKSVFNGYYAKGLGSIFSIKNKKVGPAITQAGQYLMYGHSTNAASRFEIERGFNGYKAVAEMFGFLFSSKGLTQDEKANRFKFVLDEKGEIKGKDIMLRTLEATIGFVPETMFRLLGAPDAVFKNTAYFSALYQEARRQGYTDKKQIDWFIALHSDYSNDKAFNDAQKFIYANDSGAYKMVSRLFSGLSGENFSSKAARLLVTSIAPYQKIPTNVAVEFFDFMVPGYGIIRAGMDYHKINSLQTKLKSTRSRAEKQKISEQISFLHQDAEEKLGRAAVGTALIYAGTILVASGAISGSARKKEDREIKDVFYEQNSLNVTLFLEQVGLLEPKERTLGTGWLSTDKIQSLTAYGVIGGIFAMMANDFETESKKARGVQTAGDIRTIEKPNVISSMFNVFPTMSYLLDQSFVKNLGNFVSLSQNLNDEEEMKKQGSRTLTDLLMTAISPVTPNILSSFSRINRLYKPETMSEASTFGEKVKEDIVNKVKQKWPFTDWKDDPIQKTPFGDPILQTPEGRDKYFYNLIDVTKSKRGKGTAISLNDMIIPERNTKPSWKSLVGVALHLGAPTSVMPNRAPNKIKDLFGELNYNLTGDMRRVYGEVFYANQKNLAEKVVDELYVSGNLDALLNPDGEFSQINKQNVKLGLSVLSDVLNSIYSTSAELTKNQLIMGVIPTLEKQIQEEDPEQYKKLLEYKEKSMYREGYEELKMSSSEKTTSDELIRRIQTAINKIKETGQYYDGDIQRALGIPESEIRNNENR